MPAAQSWQPIIVLPATCEYVPFGQLKHVPFDEAPSTFEKEPVGHGVQTGSPGDGANVPGKQG